MISKLRGLLERSAAARVVALLVLYLLGLPVVLVVFSLVLRSPRVPPQVLVFFFVWGIGASMWLWSKLEHRPLREMGFTRHPLRSIVVGIGAGALPIGVFVGVCALTSGVQLSRSGVAWPAVSLALAVTTLQAASEEVVFRGYCLGVIDRGKGPLVAVVTTSILFGLVHMVNVGTDPFTLLNILLWGVLVGLVMLRWRNLWLVMGIHVGWNWAQQHIFGFSVYGSLYARIFNASIKLPPLLSGGAMGPEGSAITTLVLVALMLAMLPGTRLRAAATVRGVVGSY